MLASMRRAAGCGVVFVSSLLGCVSTVDPPRADAPRPAVATASAAGVAATAAAATEDAQATELVAIATTYKTRLKEVSPWLRIAPALCASMAPRSMARMSASDDASTHGKKVYYLYTANTDAYVK